MEVFLKRRRPCLTPVVQRVTIYFGSGVFSCLLSLNCCALPTGVCVCVCVCVCARARAAGDFICFARRRRRRRLAAAKFTRRLFIYSTSTIKRDERKGVRGTDTTAKATLTPPLDMHLCVCVRVCVCVCVTSFHFLHWSCFFHRRRHRKASS